MLKKFSQLILENSLFYTTFVKNAGIFGKVYFPRITVPIATVISGLFQFIIQFIIFLGFYLYFVKNGAEIRANNLSYRAGYRIDESTYHNTDYGN